MQADRDFIIIGGGPAGLAAAQYGARSNMKVLMIEEMASGGQTLLIDGLENYPGFDEPIAGMDLSAKMERQALNFGAEILNATVTKLTKKDSLFTVETSAGSFTALTVLISTGAKHKMLYVPGEKEFYGRGISYCATCDGPFFKNKKILVSGGGDAACDEASFLAKLSDKVVMVHRRDRFRAQKFNAARVLNNPSIEIRFNTVIKEIKGTNRVEEVILEKTDSDDTYTEKFDAVFIFVGSIPQTALVPDLPKDEAGYILTEQNMATKIPGLFAAGDVRSTPFRQIVVSAAEGAIAAHSAAQYIDEMRGEAYI
jgi:thioredoxin reductase (NADPH)